METTIYWAKELSPLTLSLRCPFCNNGNLELLKENIIIHEYENSKKNHTNPDFEPSWISSSCAGILICNNNSCREHICFCGSSSLDDFEVEEPKAPDGYAYMSRHVINPMLVFPSPHFIKINSKYPDQVISYLKEAFNLYWLDKMSCANKLRIVVEAILDYFSIPKIFITRTKEHKELSTHKRLLQFQSRPKYSEAADYLLAIKWIGNLGSHSGEFNEIILSEAFEIIEKALDLLFIGSDKKLKKTRDLINKTKGRIYKSKSQF